MVDMDCTHSSPLLYLLSSGSFQGNKHEIELYLKDLKVNSHNTKEYSKTKYHLLALRKIRIE